ncbi:MAG: hypothetical protein CL878_09125 [Dehalococcoidia bacterium]|nr:hypothetical protein [Dehalococcoidia bacterium]
MDSAQRFLMALHHQEPDRVPIHDVPWPTTIDRWHAEGLPPYIPVGEYFGYELVGVTADYSPQLPAHILQRDAEFIVRRTSYGSLRRQKRDLTSTPETVEWSVQSHADWERLKPRLQPSHTRVNWISTRADYEQARSEGKFVAYRAHIGYAQFLEYVRNDELLMLLITDPDWIMDMFLTHADLVIGMADILLEEGIEFDGAFLACDLGYRNATLFSPELYRQLQFPADRKVVDFLHSRGKPVILHSDGCVRADYPHFIEAGFDCQQPLEVKAGMDLIELKREFGKDLAFMGGIDVRIMADSDPGKIEEEIRRKFDVAMPGGGYIYHSDHSVPNDVSFDQYRRVMDLVHRYGAY